MLDQLLKHLQRGLAAEITGRNAIAVPEGVRIISDIPYRQFADMPTGHVTVESLDSLVNYIACHESSQTAIFASSSQNSITAVLDWHEKQCSEYGGLARHQVVLPFHFSEPWKAWMGINGKAMGQKALAEFIEEYLNDIVAPEPAAVLETVLTLSGKKSVNYKNATRLGNGDVSLVWEETTDAKAGQSGQLQVPSEITLRLPVYAGCEEQTTYDIRTMFRYNIADGVLTFQIKMLGIERIREMAFKSIFDSLEQIIADKAIVSPLYHGAVTKTPLSILQ